MKKIFKKITPLVTFYRSILKFKIQIYSWYAIPSYKVKRDAILKIANTYNCSTIFIETGTYMGDTVEYVKNHFQKFIP